MFPLTASPARIARRLAAVAAAAWLLAATASPAHAGKIAVLVGINDYPPATGLNKLSFAENDVNEFKTSLEKQGYTVLLLTISEAQKKLDGRVRFELNPTRDNILETIRTVVTPEARNADDHVLIGFSGHGVQIEERAYFCPVDARISAPVAGDRRLIALDEVFAGLEKCPAKVKMLLCDACRDDATVTKSANVKDLLFKPDAKSTIWISSCSAGQVSNEFKEGKHGVFFHHVLAALNGKGGTDGARVDTDRDGHVTGGELQTFLKFQVPLWCLQNGFGHQVPETILFKEEGDVRLFEAPDSADWLPPGFRPAEKASLVTVESTRGPERFYDRLVCEAAGLGGQKIPVSFCLVTQSTREDPETFYIMENKVWEDLFAAFAAANPGAVRAAKWANAKGDRPATDVSANEAYRFARWLTGKADGHLPTARQWDKAFGVYETPAALATAAAAVKAAIAASGGLQGVIEYAIKQQQPVSVGKAVADVTCFGCRDMAGNGREWTRDPFKVPVVDWEAGIDPKVDIFLRGWSFAQSEPLTVERVRGGLTFGLKKADSSDQQTSFRVVVERR